MNTKRVKQCPFYTGTTYCAQCKKKKTKNIKGHGNQAKWDRPDNFLTEHKHEKLFVSIKLIYKHNCMCRFRFSLLFSVSDLRWIVSICHEGLLDSQLFQLFFRFLSSSRLVFCAWFYFFSLYHSCFYFYCIKSPSRDA